MLVLMLTVMLSNRGYRAHVTKIGPSLAFHKKHSSVTMCIIVFMTPR